LNRQFQVGTGSSAGAVAPTMSRTPPIRATIEPNATEPSAAVIAPSPPPSTVIQRPLMRLTIATPQPAARRMRPFAGTGASATTIAAMPNSSRCSRYSTTPNGTVKNSSVACAGYGPSFSTKVAHGR
jgi:hypothetical protein